MARKEWKLPDLAEEVGVSPRTVRYYVQRGLLPAPVFRGKDTVYGDEHVQRLKAIRRLQEKFLPLDAIQVELERASGPELAKIGEGAAVQPGWERHVLAPGVELHVKDEAGARRFARRILERIPKGDHDE